MGLDDLAGQIQVQAAAALIGLLETHGRAGTIQAAEGLPLFACREVVRGGALLGELDVDGLLVRRPQLVMVDGLAHTNAPGEAREKRWQDAEVLLAAGIDVISTLNVQHLESLHDTVARLTGVRVRERLPDHVLEEADELVLIDVTPDDLQARLWAGKVYAPDKVDQTISRFFSSANLGPCVSWRCGRLPTRWKWNRAACRAFTSG
ncbi:histidine kinase [Deinococcus alpinitundrae]|uniref:histidine kinase n=1 Tax=Deinococcus alpinitundrae TaxID=468913 RepID=UPI001ED97FE1|nr:hypothetical protein [Deinococcus alpinitundrae]